ncbi:hypothetical protein J3458_004878 [Metarhizium acridum]|uniref:uncharacterized protein n=1 Tax=Metarhizium acridum TaxID=92637 RepID=UPI001C6C3BB6|nr:hypothetical protein J3458_004878 [Metarhizium acridum]
MDRPSIFVGHSFWGNVIEQAIVSASFHRRIYYWGGVLGTPHRLSPAAAWGAIIAYLMPSGLDSENGLLKALERHSNSLADRLRDFSGWLFSEPVPVVCAFEQLVTDYSSGLPLLGTFLPSTTLDVDEDSACIDGHHKMSLHTDHLRIQKLYDADDPYFKLIYPGKQRLAEGTDEELNRRRNPKPIHERSRSDTLRRCLQKIRVTNPEDVLSEVEAQKGEPVENICEWILKHEDSLLGLSARTHKLFALSAPQASEGL